MHKRGAHRPRARGAHGIPGRENAALVVGVAGDAPDAPHGIAAAIIRKGAEIAYTASQNDKLKERVGKFAA